MDQFDVYINGPRSQRMKKFPPGLAFEPYGEDVREMSTLEEEEAKLISGILPEPSGPRKVYQDSLRIAFFLRQGRGAGTGLSEVAAELQMSLPELKARVTELERVSPSELPVPKQVPRYIADHGLRCLQGGIEPFRPAELRRAFVYSSGRPTFEAIHDSLHWSAAPALKRDYSTGQVHDTGHKLLREKASCGLYLGVPSIDRAIAAVVEDYHIDDPAAYLLCNHYKDGRAFIAPHQHDFWSATFSFGEPRVFLLNHTPLLLHDGDVLIFGSQRHSVPKMPNVNKARISLSLFWYPNWKADCEYTDEQLERWHVQNEEDALWAKQRAESVQVLEQLGFEECSAVMALNKACDDIDAAAEALLQGETRSRKFSAGLMDQQPPPPAPLHQREQLEQVEVEKVQQQRATEANQSGRGTRGRWRQKQQG